MKPLSKARTTNSLAIVLLLLVGVGLYKYSVPAMRFLAHKQEVADLGVEIYQPMIVAMIYVCFGIVFSVLTASFIEPQLRPNSFGETWSRFAVSFLCCFLGYILVASAIL
jgi:hypothetical protein